MQFERAILAIGALGLATIGTAAYAAPDAADAISVCARISKKDARLECYDQVGRDVAAGHFQSRPMMAAPAPAAPPAQQAPQPNWAAPPAAATNPGATPVPTGAPGPSAGPVAPAGRAASADTFGSEQLKKSDDGPKSVQAEVASASDNGLGQWRITLTDGAVWRMTETVSLFRPPAPHEMVTIRKGALGSFLMTVGKQASVRVARVR